MNTFFALDKIKKKNRRDLKYSLSDFKTKKYFTFHTLNHV